MSFYVLPATDSPYQANSPSQPTAPGFLPDNSSLSSSSSSSLYFIYSGFLPLGRFLYRNYTDERRNHSLRIHEVRALYISDTSLANVSPLLVLNAIQKYISSLPLTSDSDTFRLMLSSTEQIFSQYSAFLLANQWSQVSSLKHIHCKPSLSLSYWQSQYLLLEKIYKRTQRSSIRFLQLSSLSPSEWDSIHSTPHPTWASPSHPSLSTESSSTTSLVAVLDSEPCAWLIANHCNTTLLTVETIWINKAICSSAILYSMIFLTFSSYFGFTPSSQQSFQFGYLTTNDSMKSFSNWLKPFHESISTIHTFDVLVNGQAGV